MLLKKPIQVSQPDNTTCVHACLSMVTGIDIKKIIKENSVKDGLGKAATLDWLVRHNIRPIGIPYTSPLPFPMHGIYLIGAPSLNLEGRMHCMVLHVENKEGDQFTLYDPQYGKEDLKSYHPNSINAGGVSWCDIIYLHDAT